MCYKVLVAKISDSFFVVSCLELRVVAKVAVTYSLWVNFIFAISLLFLSLLLPCLDLTFSGWHSDKNTINN